MMYDLLRRTIINDRPKSRRRKKLSGWLAREEPSGGLEWRRHLAKIQTVIAGPCLSGARSEYFVLAFLERFEPSIPPSEPVQFLSFPLFLSFFIYYNDSVSRGSECIADGTVKYSTICIAKKRGVAMGKNLRIWVLLIRVAKDSEISKRLQSLHKIS